MPIDASIYNNVQQPPSTLETLGAISKFRGQQQQQQMNALELQQKQRQMDAEKMLDSAYSKFVGPNGVDYNGLADAVAKGGYGHLAPGIIKSGIEVRKSMADAVEAQGKAMQTQKDLAGGIGAAMQDMLDKGASLDDVAGYGATHIAALRQAGLIPPDEAAQVGQALDPSNPEQLKRTISNLKAASQKQTELGSARMTAEARKATAETGAAKLIMEAPGIQAKTAVEQQVAAGTQGGINPYQQAEIKNQQQQRAISAGQLAVAQQREKREAASDVGVTLNPQGLDIAAENYAKTGQLPAMGMGKQGAAVRSKIINRAAELHPDLDLASAKAGFQANEGSLKKMQAQRDAIGAFEQTASKNIDIFLNTAGKVVDTGSPMANSLARAVTGKMLGSPDQAAYDAARQVAINEIAKITSNPNLSGTLSDSARHEVDAFNPNSATLKQTVAVMRILKQDMANRTQALDAQLGTIKGRISGKAPAANAKDPLGILK